MYPVLSFLTGSLKADGMDNEEVVYPLFESAAFIFANSESKVCGDYNKY
jgi:hypothetical protein